LLLKKAERRHRLSTADYARLAAFRGALREVLQFEKAAAEGATRAATAANKWMAKEAAKEATAEAFARLVANADSVRELDLSTSSQTSRWRLGRIR